MITITCPSCNRSTVVPNSAAGKQAKCVCGHVIDIQAPNATPDAIELESIENKPWTPVHAKPQSARSRVYPSEPPQPSGDGAKLIAGAILLVGAMITVGMFVNQKQDAPEASVPIANAREAEAPAKNAKSAPLSATKPQNHANRNVTQPPTAPPVEQRAILKPSEQVVQNKQVDQSSAPSVEAPQPRVCRACNGKGGRVTYSDKWPVLFPGRATANAKCMELNDILSSVALARMGNGSGSSIILKKDQWQAYEVENGYIAIRGLQETVCEGCRGSGVEPPAQERAQWNSAAQQRSSDPLSKADANPFATPETRTNANPFGQNQNSKELDTANRSKAIKAHADTKQKREEAEKQSRALRNIIQGEKGAVARLIAEIKRLNDEQRTIVSGPGSTLTQNNSKLIAEKSAKAADLNKKIQTMEAELSQANTQADSLRNHEEKLQDQIDAAGPQQQQENDALAKPKTKPIIQKTFVLHGGRKIEAKTVARIENTYTVTDADGKIQNINRDDIDHVLNSRGERESP